MVAGPETSEMSSGPRSPRLVITSEPVPVTQPRTIEISDMVEVGAMSDSPPATRPKAEDPPKSGGTGAIPKSNRMGMGGGLRDPSPGQADRHLGAHTM